MCRTVTRYCERWLHNAVKVRFDQVRGQEVKVTSIKQGCKVKFHHIA